MQRTSRAFLILTLMGAAIVLVLSLWPGCLNDLLLISLLLSVCWFPIGVIAFAIVAWMFYQAYRRGQLSPSAVREIFCIPMILVFTLAFLFFYVPRRIAFRLHRRAFEAEIPRIPVSESGVAANFQAGIYQVDEWAVDPRGGIFFRVHSGGDGLGPDTMSYGFVKQPNSMGTPFGRAKYRTFPLSSGWYWFRASNDYY